MTDFRALLEALCEAEVRFVIVGGVAATLHGSARLTQDIDVVYARDSENLARIARALAPLRPYLRGAPSGLPFQLDAVDYRNLLAHECTYLGLDKFPSLIDGCEEILEKLVELAGLVAKRT